MVGITARVVLHIGDRIDKIIHFSHHVFNSIKVCVDRLNIWCRHCMGLFTLEQMIQVYTQVGFSIVTVLVIHGWFVTSRGGVHVSGGGGGGTGLVEF